MTEKLTAAVRTKAFALGIDLVGVGNIERWAQCPPLMSPAGILPSARSVVVCALHHGDGTVEIGGKEHPQVLGPYVHQYYMNEHLDRVSYELGRFLEDAGYATVPITASNIWRYRRYKDLPAVFSPDMSHIYAAVAAGLAELGYSGLALTPQFGPRNRFVSVITEAELAPDPLLPGQTLCDRCGLCVKRCPARALDKELGPEVSIEIDGRKYTRAGKNLWRCSWGEHFDLDLDLPIPEKVDERVLLDNLTRHGVRGGEMGQCLKHCLPPQIRSWDRSHTSSPRRIRRRVRSGDPLAPQDWQELLSRMQADGLDTVIVQDGKQAAKAGLDVTTYLPNAKRLVVLAFGPAGQPPARPELKIATLQPARQYFAAMNCFFAARRLEALGYDAAPYVGLREPAIRKHAVNLLGCEPSAAAWLTTSAPLQTGRWDRSGEPTSAPADLTAYVKSLATQAGADLVGVSPADRIDAVADQLRPIFDGEAVMDARSRTHRYLPYDPEVTVSAKKVVTCGDYLSAARSVIVMGARIPRASVRRAGEPPAEAIGPYVYAQAQAHHTLAYAALKLVRTLEGLGHRCVVSYDLTGAGSLVCNPRGPQPDIFCNRFEAVCAGLGTIARGGFVLNERFGPNVRFIAIVTDAELRGDAIAPLAKLRSRCDSGCLRCVDSCTVAAHRQPVEVQIDGQAISFHPVEQARCDWAKRFALVADEGFKFLGSTLDAKPPETITPDALADALRQSDPILKERPSVAEPCVLACPYAGRADSPSAAE